MSAIEPAYAAVRPRAIRAGWPDPRLLEDIIAELFEEGVRGVVPLVGQPGSGKSTALAHLAAVFTEQPRMRFLDQPAVEELGDCSADSLWIVDSNPIPYDNTPVLRLTPWSLDELIEYLLALHATECSSVVKRLGPAARGTWSPQLATIILDRFAANPEAHDRYAELVAHIDQSLPHFNLRRLVRIYCLSLLLSGEKILDEPFIKQVRADCGDAVFPLLRHASVQLPLAGDRLAWSISAGSTAELNRPLPPELIDDVGQRCRQNKDALAHLRQTLKSAPSAAKHPMAASIMHAADPTWKPHTRFYGAWNLAGGCFAGVHWPSVKLPGATLDRADFSDAQLDMAVFECASLAITRLDRANLTSADLRRVKAVGASFNAAMLTSAKLTEARLHRADFTDSDLTRADLLSAVLTEADLASACFYRAQLIRADLRGANVADADFSDAMLYETNLSSLDLRATRLDGATLTKANLAQANLEDVVLPNAHLDEACLRGTHLTGSRLPSANLRGADLRSAGLAEIHWEGADLREANLTGATFHMGSSRSGLVDSPIACEGSKTGFYTDDYEDMHFKRPEEVRKANLRGADLRGAIITGLDFYLVDLREARLDPMQLTHVRKCGAIVEDVIA